MRWSGRVALLAVVLLAAGLVMPYVVPTDEDYRYYVERSDGTFTPYPSEPSPVAYQNLSAEERSVFDTGRTQDGPVRREQQVDGSHFVHFYDQVVRSPVVYENRTYVVEASTIRTNFALRYWGRPILVLLGLVSGGVAALLFAARWLRARIG